MPTLKKYIFGFILSLTLTILAFSLVAFHLASGHVSPTHEVGVILLSILAVIQLVVQLTLFLHVGDEPAPRYNLLTLIFAIIVVVILVGGTLWIMQNLMHGQHTVAPNIFEEENIFPSHTHDK
jgi:cytochrome o ubiquinol oxidase operon protein cyoD